jgi:hypothetical protein
VSHVAQVELSAQNWQLAMHASHVAGVSPLTKYPGSHAVHVSADTTSHKTQFACGGSHA